ncbi:hypothetical protein [Acinetobacter baumannii]|uniref:hypothetical protein n=1 Tax=Acinetobacter baumannii TaxID=470 RepID=UPI000E7E8626|nr:hypothetical protein [Acinetobacter baumannii]HAV16751.1 hypothetical protein [Acinetobacter nosocomialis]MDC4161924.1 hypothetical protein [Acinetobacter baumannii]MDC5524570.1 hypothetical protein [Acinetobacter baumannii]MDV4328139.1 hypothetical protein [Acinetobacter baumannii]MDV4333416.1 hypothetical protein [Acinetobacter baumannii]
MRLYSYLDMEIERYQNQFGKEPSLYFIRKEILDTLLIEKESYINPTLVFFNEFRDLYQYKSVFLIPVEDPYLNQCVIRFEELDEYYFEDSHNSKEWPHKIKVKTLDGDFNYINVRPSVLRCFKFNHEKLSFLNCDEDY